MTRGLSKQQKQILAMLKTKKIPNSEIGYFSTQQVICEFHPEYAVWLMEADDNPFVSDRKHHIDYQKCDKVRVSVYRALRSLEKRGLVVSFRLAQSRFWAIPERLYDPILKNRRWTAKDYEDRGLAWRWGAFIRTLPNDLRLRYKLGILEEKEKEEIKRLWEIHQRN